jgi:3-hydroxybutyryl-CoA dehydrogenase
VTEDRISRVAVFGTGQMGPGIAAITALAGCATTLVGRSASSVERGKRSCLAALDFLLAHEVISQQERQACVASLAFTQNAAAAAPADLAVEAIVENLAVKQQFFVELEALFAPGTILASSTSALRIKDIAARLKHPERAVTAHFWNPPHLVPLVDVMQGEQTSEETVQRVYRFLTRCGKRPVIGRKDVPGQIGNRLQHALMREAYYMVQEGIASVEDVETAIKAGFGLRLPVYGPLEHSDISGVDLALAVEGTVLPSLCNATEPLPLLRKMVAAGNLGAKTGQGFYNWHERSAEQLERQRDEFLVERMKVARRARTTATKERT